MKTIPNILHMIWVGDVAAPSYFLENYTKWKQLMPEWEIRLWTNKDLHTGVIDKNYLDLINKTNIGAQKADLLRYYIINKFGGYYADGDIIPERSLNELNIDTQDLIICHDLQIEWAYIAIGFFAASSNHPLLQHVIHKMYNVDFSISNIHLTTGPAAFGSAYFALKDTLNCLILPHWYFYRNKKGDIGIDGIYLKDDINGIFGSHRYAATWMKNE